MSRKRKKSTDTGSHELSGTFENAENFSGIHKPSGEVLEDLEIPRPSIHDVMAEVKADVEKAYGLSRDRSVNRILERVINRLTTIQ